MPNIALLPAVGRQVPHLALHLEIALVSAVLPSVTVEAVARADTDVHGQHWLHLDNDVAKPDGALLDETEQARAALVPGQVMLGAAQVIDASVRPQADGLLQHPCRRRSGR